MLVRTKVRGDRGRLTALAIVVLLVAGSLPGSVALAAASSRPSARDGGDKAATDSSPARCGANDTPETGIQGDVPVADQQSGRALKGYNCGLAVVGRNDLGREGGGDLAWSGQCAYVRSGAGIKVVDMSTPSTPTVTQTLPISVTSENIHAVTTKNRAVLVAAGAGPNPRGQGPVPISVWDVRDCAQPKLAGIATVPGNVHNIELTEDGTKIFGSLPLQIVDITNLSDPASWTSKDIQCDLAAQTDPGFTGILFAQTAFAVDRPQCANMLAHEFAFNKAGTRMYIGGQMDGTFATSADPQARKWASEQKVRVVDLSVSPPKIIGTASGSGHGIRRATIGGKPYLIHSNENVGSDPNGCQPDEKLPVQGAAHAFLTDISNERAPRMMSELELAINRADPKYCAAQVASNVKSTIHYNEVDDPDDTAFAMLPMGNAGLRVWDVRNPKAPTEVAYFNPGTVAGADPAAGGFGGSALFDRAGNHVHYDARSGHIWVTTRAGGLWVLELEPQVRKTLDLPRKPAEHPKGAPAIA